MSAAFITPTQANLHLAARATDIHAHEFEEPKGGRQHGGRRLFGRVATRRRSWRRPLGGWHGTTD